MSQKLPTIIKCGSAPSPSLPPQDKLSLPFDIDNLPILINAHFYEECIKDGIMDYSQYINDQLLSIRKALVKNLLKRTQEEWDNR